MTKARGSPQCDTVYRPKSAQSLVYVSMSKFRSGPFSFVAFYGGDETLLISIDCVDHEDPFLLHTTSVAVYSMDQV